MRKNKNTLCVWTPTGYVEMNTLRIMLRIISSPVFIFGVAIVSVAVMDYFHLTNARIWVIPISSVGLAIMAILLRRWARGKLLISNRQAQKYNRFLYAAPWIAVRYLNFIDLEAARSDDDNVASTALYRHLGEALITLGLFEETGKSKVKWVSGVEIVSVNPIEFYTDFVLAAGIGYVLLEASVSLIPKIEAVDERVISRVLRESGIINWTVQRVSFDDDLILFVLKNETVSHAYDFSGVE